MADKVTTVKFTDADQECLAGISEKTGIQSVSDVVRFSLRAALTSPRSELTPDAKEALEKSQDALRLWSPQDFSGVRAKAAAEEALTKVLKNV